MHASRARGARISSEARTYFLFSFRSLFVPLYLFFFLFNHLQGLGVLVSFVGMLSSKLSFRVKEQGRGERTEDHSVEQKHYVPEAGKIKGRK